MIERFGAKKNDNQEPPQRGSKKELPAFKGEPPAEAVFHQERFNKMAREHAERSIVKKVLDWNAKMSAKDFAHAEAIRDDADFERRKDVEFQAWDKDLKIVTHNITERIAGIVNGEARKDIRPLLLIMGGGMKGASGAGQALLGLPAVLESLAHSSRTSVASESSAVSLDQVFDTVVGISAGAPTAAYVLNEEQASAGASIFYKECTKGEFISRKLKRLPRIMDIDVVTQAMSHGEKALEQRRVLDSKADFFIVVTGKEDGKCELIDAKTAKPGMMDAIAASMAVPIAYKKAIEVNGKEYIDGAFSPVPLEEIIKKFNPTDILILPQVPFNRLDALKLSIGGRIISKFAHMFDSLGPVEKFVRISEELRVALEYARGQSKVNIGVLWPPDSNLNPLTTDPGQVEAAATESARGVIKAFGVEQPGKINLFHSKKQ